MATSVSPLLTEPLTCASVFPEAAHWLIEMLFTTCDSPPRIRLLLVWVFELPVDCRFERLPFPEPFKYFSIKFLFCSNTPTPLVFEITGG